MMNKPGLSDSEMEVLRVLWDMGPATVRAINAELALRGRSWAYTTVATLLHRLESKGFIDSVTSTVPHVYRAAVLREDLLEQRLRDAADELCEGSAVPLVLALVQGNRFSAEELTRFQHLIDEARAKAGMKPQPGDDKSTGRGK